MPFEPNILLFLRNTVAKDLLAFSTAGLEYYGFSILMQSVEVVGSIFDGKPQSDYGMCELRFQKGFECLFKNPPYKNCWNDFFADLRGPFVHQLRPGYKFTLGCARMGITQNSHFTKDRNSQTILVYESLVNDFKSGINQFAQDVFEDRYKGKINEAKLQGRYLLTFDLLTQQATSTVTAGLSAQP